MSNATRNAELLTKCLHLHHTTPADAPAAVLRTAAASSRLPVPGELRVVLRGAGPIKLARACCCCSGPSPAGASYIAPAGPTQELLLGPSRSSCWAYPGAATPAQKTARCSARLRLLHAGAAVATAYCVLPGAALFLCLAAGGCHNDAYAHAWAAPPNAPITPLVCCSRSPQQQKC